MRVSTSYYFNTNLAAIQSKQADLVKTQEQMATGRRIVTPADDPVGAVGALQNARGVALAESNLENISKAEVQIKTESTVLDAIRKVVNSARSTAVGATGNPSTQERNSYADFLEQMYGDLLGYANTTDAYGNFVFSGFKGTTTPFQQVTGASNYQGDDGKRFVAISSGRQIQVSDPGSSVFGTGTPDDPFALITQLVTDLRDTSLTGTAYDTAVANAINGFNNAYDRIVNVSDHAAVRVQELKIAKEAETLYKAQYQNELDRIEKVDMYQAAVQLQLQQTSLEATQKAFMNASQLSLFSLL